MKKINSEISFKNNHFKFKIGTANKKLPDTAYIVLGTYIIPGESEEPYKVKIENFSKNVKHYVKNILNQSSMLKDNFIFIVDAASERMAPKKKSYLEMQIFVRPEVELVKTKSFKDIANDMLAPCNTQIIPYIEKCLSEEGFAFSKTKS